MINPSLLASQFVQEIKNRIPYLKEDSVRYIFFACMLNQDPDLNHYILELPYSMMDGVRMPLFVLPGLISTSGSMPNQELDLFYDDGNQSICIEFKFHRNTSNKPDYAHTDAAGSIFNDINRLSLINMSKSQQRAVLCRIVVYVTDDEMHNYFSYVTSSSINAHYRMGLKTFYDSPVGKIVFEPSNSPLTFYASSQKSLTRRIMGVPVVKRYTDDFINSSCCSFKKPGGCHVRIFEIVNNYSRGAVNNRFE